MTRIRVVFDAHPEMIERVPVAKDLGPFGIYAGSPLQRIKARSQRLLELEKQYLAYSG
ncbi:MAG: hypothetical protein WAW42_14480 [Candidatus Competibacteraceae bacterium]